MLELLMYVLILGVIAWIVTQIPIPQPFKAVAFGILAIMLILVLFRGLAPLIR